MTTRPTDITAQLRALWDRSSPTRKVAAIAAVVAIVSGVGYVSCHEPALDYAPVFVGLDLEDAGEVIAKLDEIGVPYRLDAGGTVVLAPRARVHEARIALAADGLPRGGGVGFEVFDDQSFATTSFVEQVNYRRALQGELARTIAALDAVDSARVHIALGERSVFKDSDSPPSASVALRLRGKRKLGFEQVRGIMFLVASSVNGLAADSVVVVDDAGNVLSSSSDEASARAQRDLEQTLARRVQQMIERVVGPGQVSVVVTADMDYAKIDRTEEIYDKGEPVVRSEAVTTEREVGGGPIGGVAGARGALPGTGGGAAADDAAIKRLAETRNYEINRVVTRTKGPHARINRLHVAVLVDYAKPATEGDPPAPRSKDELERIATLAREAAGLDDARGDRIEVHSVPFVASPSPPRLETEPAPWWLLPPELAIPIAGGAGIAVVLGVFLWWRRRQRGPARSLALPARVADVERAIDRTGGRTGRAPAALGPADADAQADPEPSVFERVDLSVRADSRRAARVLQTWLHDKGEPAREGDG